jgi:hypothetical protein
MAGQIPCGSNSSSGLDLDLRIRGSDFRVPQPVFCFSDNFSPAGESSAGLFFYRGFKSSKSANGKNIIEIAMLSSLARHLMASSVLGLPSQSWAGLPAAEDSEAALLVTRKKWLGRMVRYG